MGVLIEELKESGAYGHIPKHMPNTLTCKFDNTIQLDTLAATN